MKSNTATNNGQDSIITTAEWLAEFGGVQRSGFETTRGHTEATGGLGGFGDPISTPNTRVNSDALETILAGQNASDDLIDDVVELLDPRAAEEGAKYQRALFSEAKNIAAFIHLARQDIAQYRSQILPYVCVYCGDHGNSRDHVLARGQVPEAARVLVPTVPCCLRCNSILNDGLILGLYARTQHIAEHEHKKFDRLVAVEEWQESETRTVKGRLRQHVKAKEMEREIVTRRLANLDIGGVCSELFAPLYQIG